ncbi:MAG: transglycosylase domain-containing protein [Bacteroidales bacterium]|nr:transglycosylase domain-containing protein [Bacteroidales bacterium]
MKNKKSHIYKRVAIYIAIFFGLLLITSVGFVISVRLGAFGRIPAYNELQQIEHYRASKILTADGKLLGLYYYQNRTNTSLADVPQSLINALIATEDARFYKHKGFDVRSFFRVIFKSILLFDKSSGGGSTISQQLAKNLYPRNGDGKFDLAVDKIREIIIARRLEKIYTKDQILELYLNTVSFGENTFGLETASLTYFNKTPGDLNISESAMLIGLLKASSGYNPRLYADAAHTRRNTVLNQMVKYDYLDEQVADSLKLLAVELQFNRLDHIEGPAPYFREFLRHEVARLLEKINTDQNTSYNLYTDGLSIQTTIREDLQGFAEASVMEHLAELQSQFNRQWRAKERWKKNHNLARTQIEQSRPYQRLKTLGYPESQILDTLKIPRPTRIFTWEGEKDTIMSPLDSVLYHFEILQSGMMVMEGHSGKILAWVGGADFRHFKYDHVLASRQTGSAIKPLIYAAAIDQGIEPCDYFENDSIVYHDYDDWSPGNSDNVYGGKYSVQGALVNSINTVSVKLLMETGITHTINKLRECSITAPLPNVPSLALGSSEIPLYQMVQAYSVFLNNGVVQQPWFIEKIMDADGTILYEHPEPKFSQPVFSENTIQIMQAMMMGVVNRGTASGLRSHFALTTQLAGKTGTTQNYSDGWFIGMTPEIIAGVWVGGASPVVRLQGSAGQGSRSAMPVFAKFIQKVSKDTETIPYVSGSFNMHSEITEMIDCEDFRESEGFFDFLWKDSDKRKPGIRKEEKQREVIKFFRKIFGKKDKNK